ncbi:AbrB/MazE/SpoVT family DNA-binding domain-containing protein [Nitratireductor sp. ZSWI3]|uniref:AbrB/MazE/SpoVT family DNA-binding domain-containing protein n=1 Tax=Nitratireductor sp. ZSWI3 TaxID=2966359 RepID=UPI00214FDBA8|nr:AbrB/MazE/SpoVT family DNA-binding domain-containing protein [Nitratireductor sp. ZSWI3]MCR4267434.1 AbrB/MazE/SpoVT family DNA-binding domain-containing protein [Nitratireductor sp. ZSWI3]
MQKNGILFNGNQETSMPRSRGFAEEPQTFESRVDALRSVPHTRLKIDSAGRIVVPAEMRAAMMVKPGDTVTAEVVEGEFRIVSPDVALKRVQAVAREWRKRNPGVDVVEELIAERREEARREDERYDRLEREAAETERKGTHRT